MCSLPQASIEHGIRNPCLEYEYGYYTVLDTGSTTAAAGRRENVTLLSGFSESLFATASPAVPPLLPQLTPVCLSDSG